jgi:hypothetical protein
VDGTECGHLLRVFFQTRPLIWEVELVDVTYTDAAGRAVMMPSTHRRPVNRLAPLAILANRSPS